MKKNENLIWDLTHNCLVQIFVQKSYLPSKIISHNKFNMIIVLVLISRSAVKPVSVTENATGGLFPYIIAPHAASYCY